MKTDKRNSKNRITILFFSCIFGMMLTLTVVVLTNFKPFPNNHILDTFWINILWIGLLCSVVFPVQFLPNCKWSKWWTK